MDILSAIFRQQSRRIGILIPSVVVSEKHSDVLEITEHPVEKPTTNSASGFIADHDANNTAIEIYNSFSPMTAQAAALSSNVKINGITRKVATNSTADLLLTGTAGTTITNGSARDKNGIIWNFPASVAIGVDGTVLVTATWARPGVRRDRRRML